MKKRSIAHSHLVKFLRLTSRELSQPSGLFTRTASQLTTQKLLQVDIPRSLNTNWARQSRSCTVYPPGNLLKLAPDQRRGEDTVIQFITIQNIIWLASQQPVEPQFKDFSSRSVDSIRQTHQRLERFCLKRSYATGLQNELNTQEAFSVAIYHAGERPNAKLKL